MNRYEDFWCVIKEFFDYFFNYFNIKNVFLKINFLKVYENINCYEEVLIILFKLKERKIFIVILFNVLISMLNKVIKNFKIDFYIDYCFFVDILKIYKFYFIVYNLVLEKYDFNKNEILFIFFNSWDVVGVKSFGFNVFWVNCFNNNKEEVLLFKCDIELSLLINLLIII